MYGLKKWTLVFAGVFIYLGYVVLTVERVEALNDVPPTSLKIPKMVAEKSISTFVPSVAAPGKGLAVNVVYPLKPRYDDGAPVAVIVPNGASGLNLSMHAVQVGFVEVRFAFPGSGTGSFSSGGIFDNRGVQSQLALRDVLLFAGGKLADVEGKTISQLIPTKISREGKAIGLVGWLNGGNIVLVTLAKFANELGFLGWSAFYESPVGSMCFTGNLGTSEDFLLNHNYREGSGATGKYLVDFRKLSWSPLEKKGAGSHRQQGEPEIPGVIYFDENGNKKWDETSEFALSYACDVGLEKQIYPPQVTRALESQDILKRDHRTVVTEEEEPTYSPSPFTKRHNMVIAPTLNTNEKHDVKKDKQKAASDSQGSKMAEAGETSLAEKYWPPTIATVAESEAYFQERDGLMSIAEICQKLPGLLVTVFASKLDHTQRQSDHPHIALQYNAWLANKLKWVRLNPDPVYVSCVADMNARNFVNNQPNSSIDASDIDQYLEPEGLIPDYTFMDAAIAELADRLRSGKQLSLLSCPIFKYTNSAADSAKK